MTGLTCEKHPHGSVSVIEPEAYEDRLMGIPVILSGGVEQTVCDECGEVLATRIADFDGLLAAATVARLRHPHKLTGKEIRFVRKALNSTAKELAADLDVSAETISRWENDREPMSSTNEKMFRLLAADKLSRDAPAVDFDPAEIVRMKIRPVRPHGERLVLYMEQVQFKMPHSPKTPRWDEHRPVAA